MIFFVVDITSDIVNYAEDTTPYECDQHCDNMISNLEVAVIKFSVGLSIVVWNASKCHFFPITLLTHFDKH